jgi:hypothetical protein
MNRSVRLIGCIAALTPLFVAPRAQAARHTPGQHRVIEHPFAQWNDVADYFLVPGLTEVNFRFRAEGAGSTWLVDDAYVDPYGKG